MPKKTKRQKILAQLHRKLSALTADESHLVKSEDISIHPHIAHQPTQSFTYQNQGFTKTKKPILATDYTYVKNDLIRITIFTFAMLFFQGVLYFILRTR